MILSAWITAVTDRHGKIRYRFRKKGLPSRYVSGMPGSDEFSLSYQKCFDPTSKPPRPDRKNGAKKAPKKVSLLGYRGRSFVYFIGGVGSGTIKIGTTVNLPARLKKLQTGSPQRLRVLAVVEGGSSVEAEYHRRFADRRVNGEWFKSTGPVRDEIIRIKKLNSVHP